MRNLIFLLCFILCASSYGQLKETQKQDVTNQINILPNGGFENGLAGWTAGGSSVLSKDTSTPLAGKASGVWNPSAASETLLSPLVAVTDGMKGRNVCSIQGLYQWDSGVQGDILVEAWDGTSVIASYAPNPTTGTAQVLQFPFFTCPSSGSLAVRLSSTADAAAMELDGLMMGAGLNYVYAVPKNEVETKILSSDVSSDGVVADLTYSSLVVGQTYELTGKFYFRLDNPIADSDIQLNIKNGADTIDILRFAIVEASDTGSDFITLHPDLKFTADDPSLTFEISGAAGGASLVVVSGTTTDGTYVQLEKRNDLAGPSEGITLETTGWNVNAVIAGANPSLSTSAVPSQVEITDGSLNLTNYGKTDANIACSGTNPATGLTCAAGDEGVAISFNAPTASQALACVNVSHGFRISANSNLASFFRLVRTQNASQSVIEGDRSRILSSGDTDGSVTQFDQTNPLRVCELFNLVAGENTIRLFYSQSTSGTTTINELSAPFNFTVIPVNQGFPTPVFTDLQNSLNKKVASETVGMRQFSAAIGNTGTIITEYGDWIDSTASGGTGIRNVNILAGYCDQDPVCAVSPETSFGTCATIGNVTTTVVQVRTGTCGGSASDAGFAVRCECVKN